MTSTDESDDRYQIEFSTDDPGALEILATGGTVLVAKKILDTVLGDGHGWYCKITDSVTDLSESRHGATKGEAQEAAFHALKRTVDGFVENQEKEKEDARQQRAYELRQSERQQRAHAPSAGDNSGTEFIGKLIGVLIVVAVIVWFVFAVAIPLLVIDIAAIALIASAIRKEMSRWLLPLSVFGAVLVVADYNQGWFTKSLASNVSFLAGLVPILLYVNVLAGLIAAYFLIRNFMDERNPHPEQAGELTKRNVIAMGCLLLVGCLTFGLQAVVDSQRRHARQSTAAANPTSSRGDVATPVMGAEQGQPQPVITKSAFVGTWQYNDDPTRYIQIVETKNSQFQLSECTDCKGAIGMSHDANDANLALTDRKLAGTLRSWNFRATHGTEFDYHLAVERIDDNDVLYTVTSDLGTETHKGHRIEADTPPASGLNPKSSTDEFAIVFDPPSNVRVAPSAASSALCSVNDKGSIRILGSEGNWYKTDICGGRLGYIHRSQVKLSELTNANETEKASRIEQPANIPVGNQALDPAPGAKPSFNCSNATTPTERLICRDGELASAEFQMVAVRNELAKQLSGSEAAAFRAEHLEWFRNWSRTCNAIGKNQPETELRACIAQFLSSRTQQLRVRIR